MKLLLASRSAARRAMLAAAGVNFASVEAPLDEEAAKAGPTHLGAKEMAAALAGLKASSAEVPGALVLGADQTLEREDGTTLSKPRSREEALDQLRSLGGTTHRLHAAAAITEAGEIVWEAIETVSLTMRPLSEDFLRTYLDREYEAVRWSVGGYRIEGPGVQLFERIEGSHFAILGLPLLPLLAYLRGRGVLQS